MNQDTNNTQTTLLNLEKGFWEAAGGDGSFYEVNFAEDGLMVLPFEGGLLTKTQTIEAVKKAGPWAEYDIIDPRLVEVSDDCIALVYQAVGARESQPDYRAYICSTYRLWQGTWQLALHQQTPIS